MKFIYIVLTLALFLLTFSFSFYAIMEIMKDGLTFKAVVSAFLTLGFVCSTAICADRID